MSPPALRTLYITGNSSHNRLLYALLDHLPRQHCTVDVLAFGPSGPLRQELVARGVSFFCTDASGWSGLPRSTLVVRRLVEQLRPDVIHSNMFLPGFASELTRSSLPRPPASVLHRHHDLAHHLLGKRLHVRVDAWSAQRATLVAAVSEAVRRTLISREGVPSDRVRVIYNGLDWDVVTARECARQAWRRRYPDRRLVVAVGRLEASKGYDTLLSAFGLCVERAPDLFLLIAGSGSDEQREAIESQASALGLGRRVELLGWVEDIYDLMAAADVVAHASRDESFCQVILEAMALGVPVATTTPGGLGEVVDGWYPALRPDDPAALARELLERVERADQSRALAMRAMESVRLRFSASAMAEAQLSVYQEAVEIESNRGRRT